jgi:hypothetical protein
MMYSAAFAIVAFFLLPESTLAARTVDMSNLLNGISVKLTVVTTVLTTESETTLIFGLYGTCE